MLLPIRVLFACCCVYAATAQQQQQGRRGYATAYSGPYDMDATGKNMCEFDAGSLDDRWQVNYAAMNEYDWNEAGGKNSICGRCLVVRGTPGDVTRGHAIRDVYVKVVDQCPEWACPRRQGHNIDLSTTALEAVTGYDWDKKIVEWSFVDCPGSDDKKAGSDDKKAEVSSATASAIRVTAISAATKASIAREAITILDTLVEKGD